MILAFLYIIIGFTSLIFGANWLVNGASAIAKKNNISDLVIGLTIVAFGTSAPEIVVNAVASLNGDSSDIIFGNNIGSNNFNLFIILGISGLIYPIAVPSSTFRREIPISLFATFLILFLASDFFMNENSVVSRLDGLFIFSCFVGFIYLVFKYAIGANNEILTIVPSSNLKIWGLVILGILGLFIGGKLVVDNATEIATQLGVSQKIIGLTIIAAGTSLPELVTSIVAATKKNSDIAIGNVVGSNIFNLLLVLSISSFINPIQYNQTFNIDFLILIGGTVALILAMFIGKKNTLDRWQASVFVTFYLGYTIYLVSKEL